MKTASIYEFHGAYLVVQDQAPLDIPQIVMLSSWRMSVLNHWGSKTKRVRTLGEVGRCERRYSMLGTASSKVAEVKKPDKRQGDYWCYVFSCILWIGLQLLQFIKHRNDSICYFLSRRSTCHLFTNQMKMEGIISPPSWLFTALLILLLVYVFILVYCHFYLALSPFLAFQPPCYW